MIEQFKEQAAMILGISEEELTDSIRLKEDLYASSLHYFGMMSVIEDLTGKSIDYADIKSCATFADVIALLKSLS